MGAYARPVQLRQGMAVTSLVLAIISLCTFGGLLVGGLTACVLGIVALVKANGAPQEYGGKGMAIAGIIISVVSLMGIPIIAAIAIPSLLRARVSANEAGAIGDVRTIISAEAAYSSVNAGLYDTPECLGAPVNCIPGYMASGPTFIDTPLSSLAMKNGYTRRFHPRPAQERTQHQSPSSLEGFAYVAVPASPGQTGVRGFCGDEAGVICYTSDGHMPAISDGRCPTAPACKPLM